MKKYINTFKSDFDSVDFGWALAFLLFWSRLSPILSILLKTIHFLTLIIYVGGQDFRRDVRVNCRDHYSQKNYRNWNLTRRYNFFINLFVLNGIVSELI